MKRLLTALLAVTLAVSALSGCAVRKEETGPARGFGVPSTAPSSLETPPAPEPEEASADEAPAPEDAAKAAGVQAAAPAERADTSETVVPLAAMLHASADKPLATLPTDLKFSLPNKAYKGEPFVLKVTSAALEKAVITWDDNTLTLYPGKDGQSGHCCEALLSVALTEKARRIPLRVVLTLRGQDVAFTCQMPTGQRQYAVQKLKVDPKFVTPPAEERARIEREREKMASVLSKVTPVKYWSVPMLRPVPGQITSLYGLRRVFNGEERGSHRGLDLDGSTGEPIHACDDGKVVLAADHYYSGQVVVVDHGLGVFTLYLHMSGFNVTEGQMVKRGDTLGYVGSTGRVTGPHLHLSFNVLQNSVNPDIYLEKQYVGSR